MGVRAVVKRGGRERDVMAVIHIIIALGAYMSSLVSGKLNHNRWPQELMQSNAALLPPPSTFGSPDVWTALLKTTAMNSDSHIPEQYATGVSQKLHELKWPLHFESERTNVERDLSSAYQGTRKDLFPDCDINKFWTERGDCMPCSQCLPPRVLVLPCSGNRDTVCALTAQNKAVKEAEIYHNSFGRDPQSPKRLVRRGSNGDLPEEQDAETGDLRPNKKMENDQLSTTYQPAFAIDSGRPIEEKESSMFKTSGIQDTSNSRQFPKAENDSQQRAGSSTGTAPWVFITIAIAVVMLGLISVALTMMYRRRRAALQKQLVKPGPRPGALGESSDTQRSRPMHRNESLLTEPAVYGRDHAPLCISTDFARPYELVPLTHVRMTPAFEETYDTYCEPEPTLLRLCLGGRERDEKREVFSPSSFYNRQLDDGNKLRGGNINFHRYMDADMYVHNDLGQDRQGFNSSLCGPDSVVRCGKVDHRTPLSSPEQDYPSTQKNWYSHRKRNESNASSSTSHHSARSYISIPPTSPSENYVEVGTDDSLGRSERSTPPIKMEWLTKTFKVDTKNDLGNYQASSGTQTESEVTSPDCITVFGTPWQFGGTFTSHGGVMQAKDSDVILTVGANAVPKGSYVDIYGAIFTDTTEIKKTFEFPAEERLITPVVEYHASPAHHFQRPVCVQLPHALLDEFDTALVKVYTFSVDERGKVSVRSLPMASTVNSEQERDGWWEKGHRGSIDINTYHFSGYFCTLCQASSLPSICTVVFGSHVQITESRREVRVILYIWDRRLTIKDYLERFRKQESDVDRQLLTDMQIPLLDSASSDSRLVMRMEVMGEESDRQSWRHVPRPNGSGPLFKPLQLRKLSEVVHCCRQTDPIRVEWALDNVPQCMPSAVFQCCIDIMHVHESTRDYEMAMREDSDDLMRTFYVRDLKVMAQPTQDLQPSQQFSRVDLKRTLSEVMDMEQTEMVCHEFGFTPKDIRNFRMKFTTEEKLQLELVEECLRRHGQDKFMRQLPQVLERLRMPRVLYILEDKKVLVKGLADFADLSEVSVHYKPPSGGVSVAQGERSSGSGDTTHCKEVYVVRSASPVWRSRSGSSPPRKMNSADQACCADGRRPTCDQQVSKRSDDVFMYNTAFQRQHTSDDHTTRSSRRETHGRQSIRRSGHQRSPPQDFSDDYSYDDIHQSSVSRHDRSQYVAQATEERQLLHQKTSSSGSDSVLRGSSMPSRDNLAASRISNACPSTQGYSMVANANSADFVEQGVDELLSDAQKQTLKKELAVQNSLQAPYSLETYVAYPEMTEELHLSDSGPNAISHRPRPDVATPVSCHAQRSASSHQRLPSNRSSHRSPQAPDPDETSKKELYDIHTYV